MSAETLVHGLNEANTDRTGLTRSEPVKCNYLSLIHGSAGSYFFFFLFYFFFFFVSAFLLLELNTMEQLPGGFCSQISHPQKLLFGGNDLKLQSSSFCFLSYEEIIQRSFCDIKRKKPGKLWLETRSRCLPPASFVTYELQQL